MNTPANTDRAVLLRALHDAWNAEPGVKTFDLHVREQDIRSRFDGWVVPVASGASVGSTHELLRVLDRLQEAVERRTRTAINLFLDPRLSPPSAGMQN